MASDFNDAFQNDATRCDYTTYMSLLGKLIHIVKTRPDIAYAVNRLATRATVATDRDYISLLHIVAYISKVQNILVTLDSTTTRTHRAVFRLQVDDHTGIRIQWQPQTCEALPNPR